MKPILQLSKEDFKNPLHPLREKAKPVDSFDEALLQEIRELQETFHHSGIAVGLSAPQIGIKKRVAVINIRANKEGRDLVLVNPVITQSSGKKDLKKESCLSIPQLRGPVERREKISVSYQDELGQHHDLHASGFLSRVIQHEVDHLDGILYIDRMKGLHLLEKMDVPWE